MPAFIDGRCPKCGRRIGWFGEVSDNPGCSYKACGWRPGPKDAEAAKADEEELANFRKKLAARKKAREDQPEADPLAVACPVMHCKAPKGRSCMNADRTLRKDAHSPRQAKADYEARKNKPQTGK